LEGHLAATLHPPKLTPIYTTPWRRMRQRSCIATHSGPWH